MMWRERFLKLEPSAADPGWRTLHTISGVRLQWPTSARRELLKPWQQPR
jgi:hypothetical protein